MNKKTLWIPRTAALTALLVVLQASTAALGSTLVTGTVVNLLLIISVMTCGAASGLSVAVLSPVLAKLIGIGPLWGLIPFIAAGNLALAAVWQSVGGRRWGPRCAPQITALALAAAAKSLVLYLGVVKLALPLFSGLTAAQAAAIAHMFSAPQLVTAVLGGLLALPLLAPLKKAMERGARQN